MNKGWQKREGCWTSIGSPDVVRLAKFRGFSVIRMLVSSVWFDVKKNCLWPLWDCSPEFLRSEDPTGSRSFLRRQENFSGVGEAARLLPEVRQGETRKARLAVRQSLLHEEICVGCGETLSCDDDFRCGQRVSSRLEDSQGVGQALYARAAQADRDPGAAGDRDRRGFHEKGTYLSDCSERSDQTASNLVRGDRSIHREYGPVLRMAGAQESQEDPFGGHGYVEGIREVGEEEYPRIGDSLRQVSCDEAFRDGVGQDSKARVPSVVRKRSAIYQRAEIYTLVPPGEFDAGREKKSPVASGRQQATEYGLPSQGIVRTALGLSERWMGKAVSRELEECPQVAAAETLSGICGTDRATLGRNCRLLQIRKQSFFGIRRGTQQQDPSPTEMGLWLTRRGISSSQNPDMYA